MSSTYLCAEWIHSFEDEPHLFCFELDDRRYVIRKVEIFKDGTMVRASEEDLKRDPMALPDQPIPPVEETEGMADSSAWEITAREFEEAWSAASPDI